MTDKEKTIKELKEALDSLDITNKYRLNLIRAIEYLQEEPVSEDLEKASYYFACKCHPLKTEYSTSNPNPEVIEAFKTGAQWQKEKEIQSAIKAVVSQVPCSNEIIFYNPSSVYKYSLPQEMNKLGLNKGDKVKLIIIKED